VFKFNQLIGGHKPQDSFLLPKGISIQGDIESKISGRIDGIVSGNIQIDAKLIIGEDAVISGDITALNLIVYGRVEGNIECKNKAVICNNAVIKGGIIATTLEIEEGAVIEGSMTKNKYKPLDERPQILPAERSAHPKKANTPVTVNGVTNIEVKRSINTPNPSSPEEKWF